MSSGKVPFIDIPSSTSLIPPLGFACVQPGIFRSAYPVPSSMPFLEQLGIKTFICLCPGDIKADLVKCAKDSNINLLSFDIKVNQEPFAVMDDQQVSLALDAALRTELQPVLIFCVTGKVKTSCVVACLRKQNLWSFSGIMEEFEMFAEPEGGLCDLAYIHRFSSTLPVVAEEGPSSITSAMLHE